MRRHNRGRRPRRRPIIGQCWTIVTEARRAQVDALEQRLGRRVRTLVLDSLGSDGAERLLGDDLERYACALDRAELTLAVLPRLLGRALADESEGFAYLAVDLEPAPGISDFEPGIIRVEPRAPTDDPGAAMCFLNIPAGDGAAALSTHWTRLVERLLQDPGRRLTVNTTLRWLDALAVAAGGLQVRPAGGLRCGGSDSAVDDYRFSTLPAGIELTPTLRVLLRQAHAQDRFRAPFSDLDVDGLLSWLGQPAQPGAAISRYLSALATQRGDLRGRFAAEADPGGERLLQWARQHGAQEDPVLARVLSVAERGVRGADRGNRRPVGTGAAGLAAVPREDQPPAGVNVVGYWRSELGVADASRLLVAALDAVEVPLQPVAPRRSVPSSRRGMTFASTGSERHPFPVNLLCLNPDGVLAFREEAGEAFFDGRRTIGYWWWEVLDGFPDAWAEAFEIVDEVWVGSRHVEAAITPFSPVPVRLVPVPVPPLSPTHTRRELGLPNGFLFVTIFDYNSSFERKNPVGALRAFRRAFSPGSGAALFVKSINGERYPDSRDELAILAADHPDVHLFDGYLSAQEIDGLLACADCVVSLHRAEGFGLPLARALRSGIPVVATGFGGNLDFMEENSGGYLVGHSPATVPRGGHYPAGARWAEPDVEHAAALLRAVFDGPASARDGAARGAAEIGRRYSLSGTGERMAAELQRLSRVPPRTLHRGAPEVPVPAERILSLRHRIEGPPPQGSGPRRLARELIDVVRADRREIEEDLLDMLARLADVTEQHALELQRLEILVGELAARKADALDTSALLAALRSLGG